MTEVLGDAVLDLTADLTPYEQSMNRAVAYTTTSLDRMSNQYGRLTPAITSVSRAIDQSRLSDLESVLGHAAANTALETTNLKALESQLNRMRPSIRNLAADYITTQRQIHGAIANVLTDHRTMTGNLVAAARTQRAALDEVTSAVERQMLAVRALSGDTNAMRQLGPALHTNLLSTLTQPQQQHAGGFRQLIYGSRGTNTPGSIIDPVVVTLEAGQFANMGDRAAAIGAATATSAHAGMGLNNAADTLMRSMSATEQMRDLLSDNNDANVTQTAALLDIVHELRAVRSVAGASGPLGPGRQIPVSTGQRDFVMVGSGGSQRRGLPVPYQGEPDYQRIGQEIADAMIARMSSGHYQGVPSISSGQRALPRAGGTSNWDPNDRPRETQTDWVYGRGQRTPKAQAVYDRQGLTDTQAAAGTWPNNRSGAAMRDYIDAAITEDIMQAVTPGGGGGGGSSRVGTAAAVRNLVRRGGASGGSSGGGGGGGRSTLMTALMGGGHGGRRPPGWFGYLLGPLASAGAGAGSLGSFAGLGSEHILMTLLGLAGSGASALGGGALLASAGLTKDVVGGGADALVSATTLSNTKTYMTDLSQLNTAISTYGAKSQQGVIAQREFNQEMAAMGSGVGQQAEITLAGNTNALKQYWQQVSQGAQAQAAGVFEQVETLAHDYAPRVANAAQANLTIVNKDLKPLFDWLEGPQGVGIFDDLENKFKQDLPTAIHAFDQGIEVFLKVMDDAVKDTGGLVKGIDNFFTRVNHEPPQQLQSWVNRMVGDFRTWERFVKLLGEDIVDLFNKDAGTGKSIIVDLTTLLQKLNDYENSTTGSNQLMTIFQVHKQEVLQLIGAIKPLGHDLTSLYMNLAPPLTEALTGIIKLLVSVLNESTKLGPFVTDMTAAALVLAKLSLLGPGLKATAAGLGLMTGAEAKNIPVSAADATALGAEDVALAESGAGGAAGTAERAAGGATGVAEGAGGSALLSRFRPSSMGKSLARKVFSKAGVGEGESLAGITEASLSKIFAGFLAGGGGFLAGDALQHLIPGLHDSSTRGGTTATVVGGVAGGAALSFLGPWGTFAGAAIGSAMAPKIVGEFDNIFGIKRAEDYGKKFGTEFTNLFNQQLSTRQVFDYKKELQNAADAYDNARKASKQVSKVETFYNPFTDKWQSAAKTTAPEQLEAASGHGGWQEQIKTVIGSPGDQKKVLDAAKKWGKDAGDVTVAALNSVHPSTYAFEGSFIESLKTMKQAARPEAAQTMLEYAAELQNKGDLPKHAVATIVKGIESEFPGLTTYLKGQGDNINNQLADNMKYTKAQNTLSSTLETLKKEWYLYGVDKDVNGKNLESNLGIAMSQMQSIISSSTGTQKTQAIAAYKQLRAEASAEFQSMVTDTTNKMSVISAGVKKGSQTAASDASKYLGQFSDNVFAAMQSGTISTSKGMSILLKDTDKALKEFGIKGKMSMTQLEILTDAPHGNEVMGHRYAGVPATNGAARGAVYNIGTPGAAGHDTVPLSVGGSNIMVAPGERVAVLNRHQAPIVDSALAGRGYAGLDGLFNNVRTPNYMAQGGWVPGFASGGTVSYSTLEHLWDQAGGPPGLANVAAAIAEAESSGIVDNRNSSGASGLWQILGQLVPGNIFNPTINAENAVAKWRTAPGGGDNFSPWVTYESGAYRKFLNGKDASAGGGGGGGGGMTIPTIIAPIVTGGPTALNEAGTAALAKTANAANAYILSKVGAMGGGGGPGPTTIAPVVPTHAEEAMLRAAAHIIGLPYTYGGGHNAEFAGTPGYDCSGAVSYVLHAANLLGSPITAGAGGSVMGWGEPGPGKYITVGSRGSSGENAHMMMSMYGKYLESGGGGPDGRDDVHWDSGWDGAFSIYRHPKGYAKGGVMGDWGEVPPAYFLANQPSILNSNDFKQYKKKHPEGRAMGGWIPGASKGVHVSGKASTKTIKGPKPKVTKAKTVKTVKLPKFKALPGFDQTLLNEIADIDNYANNDLTNWQSKITGEHQLLSVEPTIEDTLGNEYINWGDPNAKYNYMKPTGAVDPSTNMASKGIFDRLKEIGAAGSVVVNNAVPGGPVTDGQTIDFDYSDHRLSLKSLPTDELGVDNVFLLNYQQELAYARQASKQFGNPNDAQNAITYVNQKLNKMPDNALDDMSKKKQSASTWIAREIYDLGYHLVYEQNETALNKEYHHQAAELSPQRSAEDAELTRWYTQQRNRLANKHLAQEERDAIVLNDRETALRNTQDSQLGSIQSTPPSGWKGDRSTWDLAVATRRANVMNDFNTREQNLRNQITAGKYAENLTDQKARQALSLEEAAEKEQMTQLFDNKRIVLDNQMTASRANMTQQNKYITADQSALVSATGSKTGKIQSSTSGSSFYATLQQYLDPLGLLRLQDIGTIQTQDIPSLQNEATALGVTVIQAQTGTSSSQDQISELQAEITQQQQLTINAQAAALNVLAGLGNLPMNGLPSLPFGGSFATGGVVPGYPGEPHVIIAHGGETVTPPSGGGSVNIHVANGMGWLSQFVQAQITQTTRQSVRRASRALPSAGGGFIMGR